jgi:hypothetical protein
MLWPNARRGISAARPKKPPVRPPCLGGDLPCLGGDLPCLGGDLPCLGGDLPCLGGDLPCRGGDRGGPWRS